MIKMRVLRNLKDLNVSVRLRVCESMPAAFGENFLLGGNYSETNSVSA